METTLRENNLIEKRSQLQWMASALCRDAGIRIEVNQDGQWFWNASKNLLSVSQKDLENRGLEYCLGIVAHEAGHTLISRYHDVSIDDRTIGKPLSRTLLNGFEDGRVNNYMRIRFPGSDSWFDTVYHRTEAESALLQKNYSKLLLVELYSQAVLHLMEPAASPLQGLPIEVEQRVQETVRVQQQYRHLLPDSQSLDSHHSESGAWESMVLKKAREGVRLLEQWVFPVAAQLLEMDLLRIGSFLMYKENVKMAQSLLFTDIALKNQRSKWQIRRFLSEAEKVEVCSDPESISDDCRRLAGELVDALLAEGLQTNGAVPAWVRAVMDSSVFSPTKAGETGGKGGAPEAGYPYQYTLLRPQIDELAGSLEQILRPQQRSRKQLGRSGLSINLSAAMTFEANQKRDAIWERDLTPEKRSVAFSLLIDLSGSMRGGGDLAALQSAILFAEAMERVGLPYAINGFQDELIPLCRFSDPLGQQQRANIAAIPLEVCGKNPGGHNCYHYNDDGPALMQSTRSLLQLDVAERFQIVLSDGRPEGRTSNAEDLRAVIAKLESSPIHLIGVGVGKGTDHVTEFYPRAEANILTGNLAATVARLVFQSVRREW